MTGEHPKEPALPEDIFNDALEMEGERRFAYLDRACAGRPDLRRQIDSMLSLAAERPDLVAPPEATPMPETIGRYRILSECGRGGMGTVYRAHDTQLGRVIALKVLGAGAVWDGSGQERFRREAQLLAGLNDENIAVLHSLEESRGVHFLTMEFVPGETLAAILAKRGPLPVSTALGIASQVARALEVAHRQRIIHRDLKPANVMVTESGRIKILDFGIAKVIDELPETGLPGRTEAAEKSLLQGTPSYMSPEQALGGEIDHRCDLWALGCLLFECLTGRQEFAPGRLHGPAAEWLREPEWSLLPKGTPGAVRSLLRSCLQVDPRHRLDSAGTAHRMLSQASAPASRSARYRWLGIGLGAAILLTILTVWLRSRPGATAVTEIVDDRTVRALDDRGAVVWLREFAGDVTENQHAWSSVPFTTVRSGKKDLGLLLGTKSAGAPGDLWLLDLKSGRTIWDQHLQWIEPVNSHHQQYISWTAQVRWPGRDGPVLAIGIRDGIWYDAAVRFMTIDGAELATYYHPGPLHYWGLVPSPSGDGQAVLLSGLNSSARFVTDIVPFETRVHVCCVALLELPFKTGQGYPYSEGLPEERDWPGMAPIVECDYLLIPPLHAGYESRIAGVEYGHDAETGVFYEAKLNDGRVYKLAADLKPLDLYISLGRAADSLRTAGALRLLPLHHFDRGGHTAFDIRERGERDRQLNRVTGNAP
jgi:hypothetical protein